ncbi:hypothetical protein [Streptomyces sp. NPDC096013]|uniref:hypothetical protein n=1 Tax=Streptomyces sp. NPDC096013 TaxID=3366069 RepID=UPI003821C02A
MTTPATSTPVYDPANPARTGAAVVTQQLDTLGLGEYWTQTGEQGGRPFFDRRIPRGHGWCRATGLAPALWPAGADLCVQAEWYPDQDIAAEDQAEHWRTRLAVVTAGLEGLGYAVRVPGPRRTPGVHTCQPLIVSRHPDGIAPAPVPADGWDHLDVHPSYKWPSRSPGQHLETILEDSRLTGYVTRSLGTHLWPPYATAATTVLWPCAEDTPVDEWDSAMARLRRLLRVTGYEVLGHGRPWNPSVDRTPYLVAYRRDGGVR